jgi:prevent-host-death family protein
MSRTITQREFRNQSAAVMNAVEAGETIVVTRNGTPVAEVRPVPRKPVFVNTEEMQRIFAISPSPDYALMRAEIDEFFGDDDRISDDDYR